jgi:CubicO group peptidase (beta-lactamase class C family)
MLKKLILLFAAMFVAALLYGGNYLSGILSAGSGFSAKNICSGYFLSGLSGELVVAEALTSAAPVLANVRFQIDEIKGRVDAHLFGFFQRRAVYTEGTGCTLLRAGQQHLDRRVELTVHSQPDNTLPWPGGTAPAPANLLLDPVLELAFTEPDAQLKRNTKAVVVIHKGQLVAEKYAHGIEADTPLIGWSMTKSVTNMLIGLLVGDGRLSIEQLAPVPLWHAHADDPRGAITIDQLLRMSSGLVFDEEYALFSDVTRMLAVEADAAGFAASQPLQYPAGTRWSYSSGTSNILSGIIKRTVGGDFQDYYEFTQQELFLPLGIYSATIETDNDGTFIGSSYMYASARDWARLGQFCLQDGRWQGEQLLPEGWIAYSTKPTPNNPKHNYGAHFWLNADPEDARQQRTWPALPADTFSMNGYQGQRVVIIPSKDLVVVRLGFGTGPKQPGIEQLVAAIVDTLAPDR